jgi:ubiquinone/menaquinone biosynthesis C-methylase UbiE
MSDETPWYEMLFERDWYDILAPGGPDSSQEELAAYNDQTEAEVDFISKTLGLPKAATLLDLCCGWGRHTIRLAQRELEVTGVDVSPYHIELAETAAKEAGARVRLRQGDMREIPCDAAVFDAVINMFTAFGYFDEAGNQQVLDEVARVLKPKGKFLIDTMSRDRLMSIFQASEWHEDNAGRLQLQKRRWDPRSGRVYVEWIIVSPDGTRKTHRHDERIYTLQELEVLLNRAGLEIVDAFGGFDGRPFDHAHRRMIVLAEKQ